VIVHIVPRALAAFGQKDFIPEYIHNAGAINVRHCGTFKDAGTGHGHNTALETVFRRAGAVYRVHNQQVPGLLGGKRGVSFVFRIVGQRQVGDTQIGLQGFFRDPVDLKGDIPACGFLNNLTAFDFPRERGYRVLNCLGQSHQELQPQHAVARGCDRRNGEGFGLFWRGCFLGGRTRFRRGAFGGFRGRALGRFLHLLFHFNALDRRFGNDRFYLNLDWRLRLCFRFRLCLDFLNQRFGWPGLGRFYFLFRRAGWRRRFFRCALPLLFCLCFCLCFPNGHGLSSPVWLKISIWG